MNCKWIEAVMAVLIIFFSFYEWVYSTWVVVIAALILLVHVLICKVCYGNYRHV